METLGWIAFYYLITGGVFVVIALGIFIFSNEGSSLWKRDDLFVSLPIAVTTIVFGWFPLILLVIYAVLALLGVFSCKLITKSRRSK